MICVLLISIIFLVIGIIIYFLYNSKLDNLEDDKWEVIISVYFWALIAYYVFILLLFYGD